jgi:hypothetical protein
MVEQKLPLGALWVIYGARLKRLQVRTSSTAMWMEFKNSLYFHDFLFLLFGFNRFLTNTFYLYLGFK